MTAAINALGEYLFGEIHITPPLRISDEQWLWFNDCADAAVLIHAWNDEPGRTADQVASAMEETADLLRL